jgi:hypothetical protein
MNRILASSFVALCLASAALGQVVVYDNTTTYQNRSQPLLTEELDNSAEGGDEVWLEGTDHVLTELKVLMWANRAATGTFNGLMRLYDVDEFTQTPGQMLYSSGLITGLTANAGMNEYTFAIPNVAVPDHLVWTLELFDPEDVLGELGPAYYHPPTVGFSDDFMWLRDEGSDWNAYSWGGETYANFGSRLTAVPEPATLACLGLGIGLLARRGRRIH